MTRSMLARSLILCVLVGLHGHQAAGMQVREGRAVGLVYDSLSGRALAGARVSAPETGAVDTTDASGRFELSLPEGSSRLVFEHARLSPWSMIRHEKSVEIRAEATTEVTLATASPRTVLERACGGVGSVVGGVIRDLLTLVPIPGAQVSARRRTEGGLGDPNTVSSSSEGEYFVCLGEAVGVSLDARLGSTRSRAVSLELAASGVAVRDLFVPASRPATLSGRVVDGETGDPLEDVSVSAVGTRLRAGTREDGRFLLRGLPPGSVGIVVERIGYGPGEALIDAAGGDSLDVTIELFTDAVDLAPMVVTVRGRDLERRRMGTRFDGLDRPEIEKLLHRSVDFDDLLRNANIPGLRVKDVVYLSRSGVSVPGVCVETSRRSSYVSDQCEMVEVYVNEVRIPEAEIFLETLAPGDIERFELLSRLEASIRYGGTERARNGVLLIYTRGR